MRERPILFSGPVVRAILEGRKTQTRRVVKPQPMQPDKWGIWGSESEPSEGYYILIHEEGGEGAGSNVAHQSPEWVPRCPYGVPGDGLWVRETWHDYMGEETLYRADFPIIQHDEDGEDLSLRAEYFKWRPSIFMPRAFSRITLEITGVRAERLRDITEEDAIAEGCAGGMHGSQSLDDLVDPLDEYRDLWNTINGKTYPWESNPWVWVIEFKKENQ
jgi:hypothetical protein